MKFIPVLTVLVLLAACQSAPKPANSIYGRWTTSFKDGSKVLAVFRPDGTHDYFINGKLFSSGHFRISNDLLEEADPICHPDYYARYRINFPSAEELQLKVIEDTCKPRIHDLDGIKMIREKK
ncbi:MAG: hypothetical protein KA821_09810 [Chitinophagaceae bacterium]|nr:hypothetical protein [Chitinophagaceae bacterium]